MTESHIHPHPQWSSRLAFILASTGAAVGLGNIWKFPYIMGENGGGAFVMVYLICLAVVATPIMISEIMLGRRSRLNPIQGMGALARESGVSSHWSLLGWMGSITGFMILSYYAVIMGWGMAYLVQASAGNFEHASASSVQVMFSDLMADPERLLLWHTLAMIITVFVVARGVNKGLETATRWMMPMLAGLLILLVGYNISSPGFGPAMNFMFDPDFSKLTPTAIVVALGHAFFTLSIGMGTIMAYGSYMPTEASVSRAAILIVLSDTAIALLAGMVIFPIVFSHGLDPGQGPGLIFQTLPIALGNMAWGHLIAIVFFVLVVIAAWTSSISMIEPAVSYLTDRFEIGRIKASILIGTGAWLLGVLSVLSFNVLKNDTLFGKNFFGLMDFLTSNIMLPLGGMLIAIFAAWQMRRAYSREELALGPVTWRLWWLLTAIVAPLGVIVVLLNGLGFNIIDRVVQMFT